MTGWFLRRGLSTLPLLLAIVVVSFVFMRLAPGGPFDADRALDPTVRANLEAHYGLDRPLPTQLGLYLKGLVHGDLGPSFKYTGFGVREILAQGAPVSFALGAAALLIALMIGVPLGTFAALHHNRAGDAIGTGLALVGICVPNFVLGPVLILVFVFEFHLLPVGGWGTPAQVVLPALTLGAVRAAYVARLARAGMLDVLGQDFVRTARAKGLRERSVILRHALRIGLLPVVQYLGPAAASILVGSVVVERIFSVPGLGSFFINAALNRDYTLAMGSVLLYSVLLIVLNLLVDLLARWMDPRVKLQ
jgi:oligopeptide transport system permease protein